MSRYPERGFAITGSPVTSGEVRGTSGESLANFWETFVLHLKSTVNWATFGEVGEILGSAGSFQKVGVP